MLAIDRHVDEVDGHTRRDVVDQPNEQRQVARSDEVAMLVVAVAEVEAALDRRRNMFGACHEFVEDALVRPEPLLRREDTLKDTDLDRDVPLDREIVCRDRGEDSIDFLPNGVPVGLPESALGSRFRPRDRRPRTESEG